MNNGEKNAQVYVNIILNEAYMLLTSYIKRILNSWKLRKANLFILYDDKQLPPPSTSCTNNYFYKILQYLLIHQ